MDQNRDLEYMNEEIEGDLRKLDELIMQLEVWSDTYTLNHKKEQERLEEYMQLSANLYDQEALIRNKIDSYNQEVCDTSYLADLEKKMMQYKMTETVIHDWVRAIRNLPIIINRSSILDTYRKEIEEIQKGTR